MPASAMWARVASGVLDAGAGMPRGPREDGVRPDGDNGHGPRGGLMMPKPVAANNTLSVPGGPQLWHCEFEAGGERAP